MKTKIIVVLAILVASLIFVGVASAQEDNTVVVEKQDTSQAILIIISTLAGAIVGASSIAVILGRLNASKPIKDSTEQLLFNSVPVDVLNKVQKGSDAAIQLAQFMATKFVVPGAPAEVKAAVREISEAIAEAATFVESVTDGEPNDGPKG